MLAVPVAVAIFAVVMDQPELVPFATLWAVVSVVELLTPSGAAKLRDSAAQANSVWSRSA